MTIIITITDETKSGLVAVTVTGEENARACSVTHMFELILAAVKLKFQPVTTYFKPRKKGGRP